MAGIDYSPSLDAGDATSLRKRILGLETLLELSRSLVSVQEARRLDGLILLTVMGLLSVSRAILLAKEVNEDGFRIYARGIREKDAKEHMDLRPSGVFARRLKASTGLSGIRGDGLPERESSTIQFLKDQKFTHATPIRAKGRLVGILLLGARIDSKDMNAFDEEMLASILDLSGLVMDNVQLYEDLRQANETLEDSNVRLQELDSMKNEFLANVGHELRTPLTCVIGFAQCLAYPDVTEDMRQEFADNIVRQSEKLSDLIDQMLDLTDLMNKSSTALPEKANLNDLIHEVTEGFQRDFKEKEVYLDLRLSPSMTETMFDAPRTSRVLRNLLDNAIKFSEKKGRVEISTTISEDGVTFSVRDHGIGIAKSEIDHIFESFRQVDGSETRTHGGAGIGLSLAKRIVEMQSGTISVASEPGKGSVFTVTLPKVPKGSETAIA